MTHIVESATGSKSLREGENLCQLGKAVIAIEEQAIKQLHDRIGQNFSTTCRLILDCKGRVVVLGMGKSGHIAKKIAATLASTGTPAFYVHAGEASHGDIGMITENDVVMAISYSGETPEVINVLPTVKQLNIPLVAITGQMQSTLARVATTTLDASVEQEACPLGLAPTSSTTAMLVLGDAIAITLLQTRGFTADDFARFHPGGSLGRRLLLTIDDIMHANDSMPLVKHTCPLDEALVEITKKSLGMTTIVDDQGRLVGVFTDGDLRRTLDQGHDIHKTQIGAVMTEVGITVSRHLLAAEALKMMHEHKITSLVVVNDQRLPLGVVHMHDLLRVGMT